MEEFEKPFFSKSKEKFTTSTLSAWWMLMRHYKALKDLDPRDIPKGSYQKLWHYRSSLLLNILKLEKEPCLLFIEEEKPVNLEIPCTPAKYNGPCLARTMKTDTVGTFGR